MRLPTTAVLSGACLIVAAGCGDTRAPANAVSVPNAVGLDLVRATKAIEGAGLCWEIEFGNRGGAAIVRQKPPPGEKAAPRTAVKLYLGLDFTSAPPGGLAQAPGCPPYLFTSVSSP